MAKTSSDMDKWIDKYISKYAGLVCINAWGETSFFYNPEGKLARGIYFMTFKEKDGANDKASNLSRDGIFRISFGVGKKTFTELFGPTPPRPSAGGVVDMGYDFSEIDCIMPHPVYGWGGWICCLNPSRTRSKELVPLIDESYELVKERYLKKKL